jgi:hypothetical protein
VGGARAVGARTVVALGGFDPVGMQGVHRDPIPRADALMTGNRPAREEFPHARDRVWRVAQTIRMGR